MRRVLSSALVALVLLSSSAVPALETTVYITRTGAKYHRGGCRYLSKSKIEIKLSEAKKYHDPCKVCKPPR